MKKQNIAIIGVVALVLAIAVGYALFSETITINGTATAKGNFDMDITAAEVSVEKGSTGATAIIADDQNSLEITVPRLEYPGAYVEIPVTVTNNGSITALLKEIKQTGMTETSPIKVTYTGPVVDGTEIEPTDSQDLTIKVEWLAEDGNETMPNEDNATDVTTDPKFKVELIYEQVTAN